MDGTVQRFANNYTSIPAIQRRLQSIIPSNRTDFYASRHIPPIPSTLQGPGILYLPRNMTSTHACFQNYLVDVSVSLSSKLK